MAERSSSDLSHHPIKAAPGWWSSVAVSGKMTLAQEIIRGLRAIRAKPAHGCCEITTRYLTQKQQLLAVQGFMCWLGGRDSNPDTVVQSHVSYRWTTSQQAAA